jgi:hypothetical protein
LLQKQLKQRSVFMLSRRGSPPQRARSITNPFSLWVVKILSLLISLYAVFLVLQRSATAEG